MPSNHYEVLALRSPLTTTHGVSQQDIKSAYRQALLQHHPDKSISKGSAQSSLPKYTIDEITIAYKTLSDTYTRSIYDRSLQFQLAEQKLDTTNSYIGSEIVDLDDLQHDGNKGHWYRSCRCGNKLGFLITEDELEKEAEQGEIFTGCSGCSLVLRVVFQQTQDG